MLAVAALGQCHAGQTPHEALEALVARDEIGLGIHLDDGARLAAGGDANQAFGGHSPGLLGRGREAFLAQPIDGRFEIAAG